jgi:hypothetical protein
MKISNRINIRKVIFIYVMNELDNELIDDEL